MWGFFKSELVVDIVKIGVKLLMQTRNLALAGIWLKYAREMER